MVVYGGNGSVNMLVRRMGLIESLPSYVNISQDRSVTMANYRERM